MDLLTFLLYLSPIILVLYLYINRKYSFWSDRGVSGPRPIFPFGYVLSRFTNQPIEFELDFDKKYGKIYGVYNGMVPTLTIADVDLVKTVLVKDFHMFINRRRFNVLDKHWKKNLFMNQDEDWKRIRSIATPAFTSGKLRRMFPLLKQSTDKLENYLAKVCKDKDNSVDIKKIIAGFTIDVIASTSFGTDTDSNGDRSQFNPFLHHGQRFFHDISMLRFLLIMTMPKAFIEALNIPHPFAYDSFDFFVNVCKTMIEKSGRRDDLITLLKEANISDEELNSLNFNKLTASSEIEHQNDNGKPEQNNKKDAKYLTDDEIISQCIFFFVAGFETTASAITHTIFKLSHDSQIQQRLCDEVCEKLADIDVDNLEEYYETITNKIPYLDAVLKETLRMYPPVTRLERCLNADGYKLGDIPLEKGNLIEISTVAMHYDPNYFSNPHEYFPERFLPENKHKIVPYSYIPFGEGPRNCVGMRFAYQEAKICLASLIQKYRFEANAKTPKQLQFPKRNGLSISLPFEISIHSRSD